MTLEACAALVERADPVRFAAVMAAPAPLRPRLWPLYAFNIEVARAPWVSKEPMIAEMRLQWWRDVIDGAGQGIAPAHEVAGPFASLLAEGLPLDVADALVDARRHDIYPDPFEDEAALIAYLDATAGGLMVLAARALGGNAAGNAAGDAAARHVGRATGVVAYLRAIPDLEARGRQPLPDGRAQAVADLARKGLGWLEQGFAARAGVPPAALLTAAQTRGLLTLAIREPGRVADGLLHLSPMAERGRLLWQALSGRF